MQNTNYIKFINNLFSFFKSNFIGPWKRRSLGLLSFFGSFYLTSQISTYFIDKSINSILFALSILIILEIPVRLKNKINEVSFKEIWLLIDYSRIGVTYSLVLEAFKLGS